MLFEVLFALHVFAPTIFAKRSGTSAHTLLDSDHVDRVEKAERRQARLVSVADLHGDYGVTLQLLEQAGLIYLQNASMDKFDPRAWGWLGGDATLVQLGDIVDRGDFAKQIYELLFHLQEEAPKHDGKVVMLLGNHEVMNLMRHWSYVSLGDLTQFDLKAAALTEQEWNEARDKAVPSFGIHRKISARIKEWSKDGMLGRKLRQLPVAHLEGEVLFVHAGLHPDVLAGGRTIADLNNLMRSALQKTDDLSSLTEEERLLVGDKGPVWTRYLSQERGYSAQGDWEVPDTCATVGQLLEHVGARRIVVGHTIQAFNDIRDASQHQVKGTYVNAICGGRVVLSDTAMSYAYDNFGGRPAFVEHDRTGGAEVIYPVDRKPLSLLGQQTACIFNCESVREQYEKHAKHADDERKLDHLAAVVGTDVDVEDRTEEEDLLSDEMLWSLKD